MVAGPEAFARIHSNPTMNQRSQVTKLVLNEMRQDLDMPRYSFPWKRSPGQCGDYLPRETGKTRQKETLTMRNNL